MAIQRRRLLVRVFTAPTLIALSSAIGLGAGVLGDGIWDVMSWLALGLPLFAIAWHSLRS